MAGHLDNIPIDAEAREKEIADYRRMIKHFGRDTQDLISTYGVGVRPAWVSSEIAVLGSRIASANKMIEILEGMKHE